VNIVSRDLSYRDLDTPLTGLFCWNEAQEGPRPGILLIHGGAGLDAHARQQACRYAALGYAVLACDMFGDGIAGDRERVMACLLALRDAPDRLVRRGQAGLAALADCPEAAGPAAAVGFCFGGMAALAPGLLIRSESWCDVDNSKRFQIELQPPRFPRSQA
jgi:dienelactone hydrolase